MRFLLIHGGGSSGETWAALAGILERAGHEVARPSLSDPAASRLADHANQAAAALDGLRDGDAGAVAVVGHSYGGLVAGEMLLLRPEAANRAVFLDAALPEPGSSLFDLVRGAGFDPERDFELPPHPCYLDPATSDWRRLAATDKLYIHCRQGPFAPVTAATLGMVREAGALKGWRTAELEAGHHVQREEPGVVAGLLLDGRG